MILYGNPQELLGANSTELEVLYGAEDMGRSFLRRQVSRAAKVVKKTPIATVARVTSRVAKKTPIATVARVVKRNAPVAARVTSRVVRKAAPVARQVLKNPLVQSAAASLVPGGSQALSLYSRLTAAKKEIIPKFTTATTTAPARPQPQPQPGRPPRKPRQRTWKPGLPNTRTPAATTAPAVTTAPATTTAPGEESFFTKHKTPLLVGGVSALGLLALLAVKKKG